MPKRPDYARTPTPLLVATLTADVPARQRVLDRFLRLIDRQDGEGCWLWRGPCPRHVHARHGEPIFQVSHDERVGARRLAYIIANGSVPAIARVLRRRPGCHPRCVRPEHAQLSWPKRGFENQQDARRRRLARRDAPSGEEAA